jgi:hypothetical protein
MAALSGFEDDWAEEIEHRLAAFDRGEFLAYPAEDVFADARQLSTQSEVPKP